MADVIREKIRAKIVVHSSPQLVVETPYVLAFSVNKQRGQLVSNFSATIEVPVTQLPNSDVLDGQGIEIHAGIEGNLRKIFTGEIKSLKVNPSWDKPEYLNLDLSGSDILNRLDGKRFSRRIPWSSGGVWAKIVKINSTKGRKKVRLLDNKINLSRSSVVINDSPDLASGPHDRIVYARDLSHIDPYSRIKEVEQELDAKKEFEFEVEYVV